MNKMQVLQAVVDNQELERLMNGVWYAANADDILRIVIGSPPSAEQHTIRLAPELEEHSGGSIARGYTTATIKDRCNIYIPLFYSDGHEVGDYLYDSTQGWHVQALKEGMLYKTREDALARRNLILGKK